MIPDPDNPPDLDELAKLSDELARGEDPLRARIDRIERLERFRARGLRCALLVGAGIVVVSARWDERCLALVLCLAVWVPVWVLAERARRG